MKETTPRWKGQSVWGLVVALVVPFGWVYLICRAVIRLVQLHRRRPSTRRPTLPRGAPSCGGGCDFSVAAPIMLETAAGSLPPGVPTRFGEGHEAGARYRRVSAGPLLRSTDGPATRDSTHPERMDARPAGVRIAGAGRGEAEQVRQRR